jgi:mannose-6-phosphate isomerase-like protein (cupin superfamily)
MSKAEVKSIQRALGTLTFLPDRRPDSTGIDSSFLQMASYRDGGIYLTHYAGNSEWERHPRGDEVVFVVGGETTLVLLMNGEELPRPLQAGELLVVPQNTWHRFESPRGVQALTVTPQPTDHSIEWPKEPGSAVEQN